MRFIAALAFCLGRRSFSLRLIWQKNGFLISPRLHHLIQKTPHLRRFPETKEYLFEGDQPKKVGTLLKNPKLARTFTLLSKEGIAPFYQGELAQKIVDKVQNASPCGHLTPLDFAIYRSIDREPIVFRYKGFEFFGFPPPSAGGIALCQILGMLEGIDLAGESLASPRFLHLFAQASALAYADKRYYIADPFFFPVPQSRLCDPQYIEKRRALIVEGNLEKKATPGLWPSKGISACPTCDLCADGSFPCTTHFCIVDEKGNAACMTASVEYAFGSGMMVEGFFLNNQLTDFLSFF